MENEEIFLCLKYVEEMKLPAAAKATGISTDKAKRMIRRPLVRKFLRELMAESAEISLINKLMVEDMILDLRPKVMGEEAVPHVTKDGSFEAPKFDASSAIRLVEVMAKQTGEEERGSAPIVNINIGDMVSDPSSVKVEVQELAIEGEIVDGPNKPS